MTNAFVSIMPGSERAKHWLAVFGRLDEIPVTGWVPQMARLPGFDKPQAVYLLDLNKITREETGRLVRKLAERFNYPESEVAFNLGATGCPILAVDVLFHTTDPLPLIMSDDFDDDDDGGDVRSFDDDEPEDFDGPMDDEGMPL